MEHPKKKLEALGRMNPMEFKAADKLPCIVVLDNIRSGLNVGSIFRTADAYRLKEVRLCGITAQPPQKDIRKSALGATESMDWTYWETTAEALADLKADGWKIASIEQAESSVSLEQWEPGDHKWALVVGNEVRGVDQGVVNRSDAVLELPQFGTKHSLNVSVCAGIVVWEAYKKMAAVT